MDNVIRREIQELISSCNGHYKVTWDESHEPLVLHVLIRAKDGEEYRLRISLDGYKMLPPLIEFVDPETGEINTPRSFPNTPSDSFFHSNRVICHPCSRLAYMEGGPHKGGWQLEGWLARPEIGNLNRLSSIVGTIWYKLNSPAYMGPMAPRIGRN